jgi:hypothetical protein
MAQMLTSKNASKNFHTSKNTSLFNIKGGPLPPHQNHPATDTHLIKGYPPHQAPTGHPSHQIDLLIILIKHSSIRLVKKEKNLLN